MLYMFFQYDFDHILIQRILFGLVAIIENNHFMNLSPPKSNYKKNKDDSIHKKQSTKKQMVSSKHKIIAKFPHSITDGLTDGQSALQSSVTFQQGRQQPCNIMDIGTQIISLGTVDNISEPVRSLYQVPRHSNFWAKTIYLIKLLLYGSSNCACFYAKTPPLLS